MAKGYVIVRMTVLDPEGYKTYVAGATAAIKQYGGRPLVRGGKFEICEGEARARNVVIEFDSFDQAKTYYYSPEYQAALKHRLGISIGDIVVVEGAE
jgi:uncharacterized protein (DUF1330 family)